MNITQVKVFPVHEDKLKAFVSVVFDHAFMVNDIKVIQGKDGLFLSMPSRRKKNGEFKDVAHPLNNETRRMLEERVLAEYRKVVDDPTPRRPDRQGGFLPASGEPVKPPSFGPSSSGPSSSGPSSSSAPPTASPPPPVSPASSAPPAAVPPVAPPSDVVSPSDLVPPGETTKSGEKSLEEVQEQYQRDSFWSVS